MPSIFFTVQAVLADSEVPIAKLGHLENHNDRPEVQQALHQKYGSDIRRSVTINKELFQS